MKIQFHSRLLGRLINGYFVAGYIALLYEMVMTVFINSVLVRVGTGAVDSILLTIHPFVSLLFAPFEFVYYQSLPSQMLNPDPVLHLAIFMSVLFVIGLLVIVVFEYVRRILLFLISDRKNYADVVESLSQMGVCVGIMALLIVMTEVAQNIMVGGLSFGALFGGVMTAVTGVTFLPLVLLIMLLIVRQIVKRYSVLHEEMEKIV